MCFDYRNMASLVIILLLTSCSSFRKMERITSGEVGVRISVPDEKPLPEDEDIDVTVDSIRSTLGEGPLIMNAIRDSETGEMIATDIIAESKVTARFRNVAERSGFVTIGFDVTVPSEMADSRWQLKIRPRMAILSDTVFLDPVFITGSRYREHQLRGYERYRQFMNSIIRDTSDFLDVGQLEIFLQRHFPDTYAMKTDSTYIAEPLAENLFGVTQRDALEHYRKHLKIRWNERRKEKADRMFSRYVKDPIVAEGIRLDTVLTSNDGDFIYRYMHTFRSSPGLKKVVVSLSGQLYEMGVSVAELPFPDDLTFYISSLSTLLDMTPKYLLRVVQRIVYDNTKALIDFRAGSSAVDTAYGNNASELARIRRCIDDVVSKDGLVLDSLVIMASCSPEGSFQLNTRLSRARSESVLKYVSEYVPDRWRYSLRTSLCPENWDQLILLVKNDTVMDEDARRRILAVTSDLEDPDLAEKRLSSLQQYRYLREKIYPALRSVRFDFHLHREGMVKDTIHTTELDTLYMQGIMAMKELDYKRAVSILRPYDDYNAALAFMSADYNNSALDVLGRLDDTDAGVCYLKSMVLSRLGRMREAAGYYRLSVSYDPSLEYRANLDPEMHTVLKYLEKLNINP